MNVHNYSNSLNNSRSSKKYLIDFLIIFLAVSVGFIGNNFMNNISEKAREKEYTKSLYDELKLDTTEIQQIYNEKVQIQEKFDSAEIILSSPELYKYDNFIYYIERYLSVNNPFIAQDIIFQELKSSNGINNPDHFSLYKKIADYYDLYKQYQDIEANSDKENHNGLTGMETILFNVGDLTSLDNYDSTSFYSKVTRPSTKLKPISMNVANLKYLYIKIDNAKKRTNTAKTYLRWLKYDATEILNDLKKEYNLK